MHIKKLDNNKGGRGGDINPKPNTPSKIVI
jgi:hypothetical protein